PLARGEELHLGDLPPPAGVDPEELEDTAQRGLAIPTQILRANNENLFPAAAGEILFQLEPVAAGPYIEGITGEGLLDRPVLESVDRVVQIRGQHSVDRLSNQVDQAHPGEHGGDAPGHSLVERVDAVARGSLTHCDGVSGAFELALVPLQ